MSADSTRAASPSASSMSSLVGAGDRRWSLSRAIDALGDAARQAGPPGLIWIAGLVYPTLSFGFGNLGEVGLQVGEDSLRGDVRLTARSLLPYLDDPGFWSGLALFIVFSPLVMRLVAGLARISTPSVWRERTATRRTPRLRDAWSAGKGRALSSLGLYLQLLLMVLIAAAILIVPPFFFLRGTGLSEESPVFFLLLGPFIAVWLIYGMMLSVVYQLALHSLAQNDRGVTSAVVHAWRIVRNDPWATARSVLVDLVLYLFQCGVMLLVFTCVGIPLIVPLLGFAGVTRAAYWARAYRALGGLSPDDHVPGLVATHAPEGPLTSHATRP